MRSSCKLCLGEGEIAPMRLFDRNSLVSQILLIFIVFNIIAMFSFAFYVLQQDRKSTIKNMEDSLQAIAAEKANTVSLVMGQIVKETESLAKWTTEFLASEESTTLPDYYKTAVNGVLHREVGNNSVSPKRSAVYFPATGQLTEEIVRCINATEKLDTVFEKMQEGNPYVQWIYIATEEGLLRIYPYSSVAMFDASHMQKEDPFYVAANQYNNPERKTVWTNPYVDYLGTGWMITCSVPLYDEDEFIGVACIDVRLDTIQNEFLADFRLGDSGIAYLLEKSGTIIYHPSYVPMGDDQGQMFLTNILEETKRNMNYKAALEKILSGNEGVLSYTALINKSQNYQTIAYATVDWQPWILAVEVNQNHYLSISNLEKSSLMLFSIVFLLIFICFAFFLYRQYSRPFKHLIDRAKSISDGNFELQDPIYNYTEVEALSNTFNSMSTKIKDYTDNLIKKNNEIQSIINGIGGLLMILTPEYDIITMNQKSIEAFGKKEEEIKGMKCHELITGCEKTCKGCKLRESLLTKSTKYSRITLTNDIFQNTYYPILTTENEVLEIIVYSQKITKRVMLEKELSQSEKMSEIGQLTSAIAHELKNPLAAIKGSSYLLTAYTKNYQDETIGESINAIMQATENAEDIIYSLLEFSSPAKGNYTQGNITKIIDQIVLLTRRSSIYQNIVIETKFDPNPLLYYGDTEPLKHIFLNLVSNAINAMETGGTIRIQGYYSKNDEGSLILSVKDDGPGIDDQLKDTVFDPFFTTDTSGKGTGMGLWITKIMVEKMQGTISLNSTKGKGTEFIITLPNIRE